VAEQTSGIDLMRRRMERASRRPPPPRRARTDEEGAAAAPDPRRMGEGGEATGVAQDAAPTAPARPARARRRAAGVAPTDARRESAESAEAPGRRLAPDLPPVNLAIRVRKPLDDRLADLIHALRREGVRTSKVELIEMLLWELPEDRPQAVRERLRGFRACAPRGAGAPLDEA